MDKIFIFGAKYLYLISVAILIFLIYKEPRHKVLRTIFFIFGSFVLAYVLAYVARMFFYNPRPFVVGNFTPLIPHVADNGFPSEHTLLASAIAAVTIFLNKKAAIFLWIVAVGVAISRVLVGVHHSVDVIASALIALISALVVYALARKRIGILNIHDK